MVTHKDSSTIMPDDMLQELMAPDHFCHGVAWTLKDVPYGDRVIPINTEGIITAWLPEENIYAIRFDERTWLRTDKKFLEENFKVLLKI